MKMRPIHRPPRSPAGRYPHCRWSVFIDDEATPYEQHANLALNRQSKIADIAIEVPDANGEPGGWPDYSGPFDPGFQLEDLSHRALVVVNQEAAVQTHLLVRAYMRCIAQRFGDDDATHLGRRQWTGSAALGAHRLRRALAIEGDGIDAIAKVFQLHPHFWPRSYVDFRVELSGPRAARISIGDCPALREGDPYSWFATLAGAACPALDAIAGAVNPHARCHPAPERKDAALAWDVVVDPGSEPQAEPVELGLARISRGADFELMQRRPLRM
jgi:hypothetical protein